MDAPEPAGAHEPDPARVGDGERSPDGRRADGALHSARRQVARPDLARVDGEALELGGRETHHDAAVEDADRRRHRTCVADRGLARAGDLEPVRNRKAVCDERRLERDDALSAVECLLHLVGHADELLHDERA